MSATDLTLSSDARVGTQYVYVKQLWADAWEFVPGLECAGMTWGTIPSIGQATLERPFGLGMFSGDAAASYKAALAIQNYFVKVEYYSVDGAVGPLVWYGVVGLEEKQRYDRVNDGGTRKLSGHQTWHCYELGYLLDRKPIRNGYWYDGLNAPFPIGQAPTFNDRGVPNRSKEEDAEAFYFAEFNNEDAAEFWSSRDIVSYLLAKFRPEIGTETGDAFTLAIENEELLPDWDKPEIVVHGATLWDALSRVIDRRRGLGGYFYVQGSEVRLKVYTLTDSELNLGGDEGETLAANPTQYNLIVDWRPDLGSSLKLSCVDQYDRVILEGRRRRAVCTLEGISHFTKDWSDADETKYDEGASNQDDFSGLSSDEEKRKAHDEVRRSAALAHVYARFKIVDDWDGKTEAMLTDDQVVFPDDDDATKVYGNWPAGWRLLQSLPLYAGLDYSGTHIADGDLPTQVDAETAVRPVMVMFPRLDDATKWFDATQAGERHPWALRMRVEDEKPRFWLEATGGQGFQDIIAADDFTPEAEDEERIDAYAWGDALVTLCFEEQRRATAIHPAVIGGAGADIAAIREKILDVGDGFCQDYVTPYTVIGLATEAGSDTGELLRSTSGGYVRDDTPKMRAMAAQLYDYYHKVRKVLRLQKVGLTDELWLGDYITQLGAAADSSELVEAVGTVVTQITVSFPQSSGGAPAGPPMIHWETSQGELDALVVPVRRRA